MLAVDDRNEAFWGEVLGPGFDWRGDFVGFGEVVAGGGGGGERMDTGGGERTKEVVKG